MRKVTLSLIAAAVAASTTPAMANNNDNFTGPRAEVLAGFEKVTAGGVVNTDGAAFAVAAGYDFNAGPVILGLEAEIGDSSTEQTLFGPVTAESGRTLYAGARIGKAVSSKAMIYAKAGYANTELRITNGSNTLFVNELDGIRGGAGVEYKINDNMHVKSEYRYTNYNGGISSHQGLVGIGIRF